MRSIRWLAFGLLLLAAIPVARAGTIPFLPGFTDTYGFTPQSTVTVVGPDNTLAIFKQDPQQNFVELYNDPAPPNSHLPLVTATGGATLLFDYELYEFGTDVANPDGNTEMLRAILTNGNTGAEIPGTKLMAGMWTSGTLSWDLSPYAGKTLGVRLEMVSDLNDPFTNGHLNVMNLRIVPTPGSLLAAVPLLGALLLARRRRRQYMPS